MSESLDPSTLSFPESVINAGLAFAGAVLVGLISFFGGRGSVQAQLQGQLNNSFQLYIKQLEKEREDDTKKLLDLQTKIGELWAYNRKLAAALRESGQKVPEPPNVEPIFIITPSMADLPGAQ